MQIISDTLQGWSWGELVLRPFFLDTPPPPFYHVWPFITDGGQPEPRLVPRGAGPLASLQDPPPTPYHHVCSTKA
jgi:hypothetical protein